MTLRKRLAALAVAGLTLPGCTYPLLSQSGPHESNEPAALKENQGGRLGWLNLFASRSTKKPGGASHSAVESKWAALAQQLEKRGETAEAEKLYQAALREQPDNGDVHHRLGVLLARRGETTLAHEHLQAAALHNPASVEAANDLGYCCYLQGRHAEAEAALRRALELKPDHAIAANNLASVLRERAAQNVVRAPAPLKTAAAPAKPPPTPAALAPPLRERKESPPPVEVSPSEAREETLVVVLPQPASEEAQAETAHDEDASAEESGALAALPHSSAENESAPVSPADAQIEATAAEDTPAAVHVAPAKEPMDLAEPIASRRETTSSAGRASSEGTAIVRLLEEDRIAAPCASPAPQNSSPAANEASAEAKALDEEIAIPIPTSSAPVPAATASSPIEDFAADEFVRYEPQEKIAEATSAAPRRSVFGSEGLLSRGERSLLDELPFGSLRQPRGEDEQQSQAALPPQEAPPQPRRRSLLSTLRSLNPLGLDRGPP